MRMCGTMNGVFMSYSKCKIYGEPSQIEMLIGRKVVLKYSMLRMLMNSTKGEQLMFGITKVHCWCQDEGGVYLLPQITGNYMDRIINFCNDKKYIQRFEIGRTSLQTALKCVLIGVKDIDMKGACSLECVNGTLKLCSFDDSQSVELKTDDTIDDFELLIASDAMSNVAAKYSSEKIKVRVDELKDGVYYIALEDSDDDIAVLFPIARESLASVISKKQEKAAEKKSKAKMADVSETE